MGVLAKKSNGAIAFALVLTVLLWGASNAGTKRLVATWPSIWVGSTRFLLGGLISLLILRYTNWLGPATKLTPEDQRGLWLRGGLTLAVYIVVFNLALHLTSAAHVALYLGAAPVWALLWEERPSATARSMRRYASAALALSGVMVLFWPSLRSGATRWIGELLGVLASVLWAVFGFQGRALGARLAGTEISAHAMFRSGVLLLPFAVVETVMTSLDQKSGFILFKSEFWNWRLVLIQLYCAIGGGTLAYALFYGALRHWTTSRVYLFNYLIPVSTMIFAHFCLGEPVTTTFWAAIALVMCGVALGQEGWLKVFGTKWLSAE